ncbi:TetR/AcrR family transcriptional regulator [Solirubrobacter ginsenosidimutans]|uniref:TetR/AcrR family transcriptional regulator n=1 Tax=Solirubrobacter ginsenosidimutans TaxID=490573 RepID=A0A9X3S188_9ACTN|nr:TetR/AcrR family transcriptional regulator [Solirubrobacter ginsenosidimutans]MDA0162104.1 TetR/AcrR family transcriptional regulator [Solirubrobacter ginsenosidimutans]
MSQPPTSPALRERYDRRQQAVVTTAAALFARRGFQATSMDELSEATGLRSGGLYHYIGSKQNLLLAIFGQLMDPLLARAAEIEAGEDDPQTQLRALVRAWLAHIETHLDHMAVFAQERHTIEHEPEWEQVRASRDAFEAILARRLAAVGLTDRLALFALLGMVNHTATWLKPGGRLTSEQIADGYCDMLLR